KEKQEINSDVLFIEVDGLYTKSQEKQRSGRELKIAAVHQGWEVNGKRVKLKGKQHFIYTGKRPFWEEFENYLMNAFEYHPTQHHLVINGDGTNWITSCREYFQNNATFVIDRFHIACDVRQIFREHPRYHVIRKKLSDYDAEGFMIELNSAVGTLAHENKEEQLEALISQLSQYPEAFEVYQVRMQAKGIDAEGFRPMGSAEGTMSVFAKRLKNGRSWCKEGITKFSNVMVALMDGKDIQTLQGYLTISHLDNAQEKPPKHFVERLSKQVTESMPDNILYLNQTVRQPVVYALKGLRGY